MNTRRARLRLAYIDPWSAVRTAFLLGAAIAVTITVALVVLYLFLTTLGLFDAIDRVLGDVTGTGALDAGISSTLSLTRVFLGSLFLGAFETVVLTALAAVFAFIYNATVAISGGLNVWLEEDDGS